MIVKGLWRPGPRKSLIINHLQQNKKKFDTARFTCYLVSMTKSEIESNISHLLAHLQSDGLSEVHKTDLRNGIRDLEDKLALLEFESKRVNFEEFDYGYHDEYDM